MFMRLLIISLILNVLFISTGRTSPLVLHSYIYIEHTFATMA